MSYTKRTDIDVPNGHALVELDSGHLVLIFSDVKLATDSGMPVVHVRASWVDETLAGKLDHYERLVSTEFKHTTNDLELDRYGLPALIREVVQLVLGEPLTVDDTPVVPPSENPLDDIRTMIPWPPELVHSVDVRRAIRVAEASVVIDLGAVL